MRTTEPKSSIDTLAKIRGEKLQVKQEIKECADRMKAIYQDAVAPPEKPATKMESVMKIFDQGMAIYDGVMIGMRVVRTFKSLFGFRRKKKW